jgi:hypothetical protein
MAPVDDLEPAVQQALGSTPIVDIHTHLYLPSFGLTLWGIDELLTYHYLVAETLRSVDLAPAGFFALSKTSQADLVWDTLFVRNTPVLPEL